MMRATPAPDPRHELRVMIRLAIPLVIGQVLHFHVQDEFYNPASRRIDTPAMHLVGRVHGSGFYARATDLFELHRPLWADRAGEK